MTHDLRNKIFGRLTAIEKVWHRSPSGRSVLKWRLKCICGGETIAGTWDIISGDVKSCGCLPRPARKHGHARKGRRHPLYLTWVSMKDRCHNPKNLHWNKYGGVGIKVCDRWLNNFENFLSDLGEKPTRSHSLDRYPDPHGHYSPENTRWATKREQALNRRINAKPGRVFYNGIALRDLAKAHSLNVSTVMYRFKRGMRGEALFGPDLRRHNGKRKMDGTWVKR